MASQKEPDPIRLYKRRRRLRTLGIFLAAGLLYWGYREWSFRSWRGNLEKNLAQTIEDRQKDFADYLVRCEEALLEGGVPNEPPVPPPSLKSLLEENPSAESLGKKFEEIRPSLTKSAGQRIFAVDPEKPPFQATLLKAPTWYVTDYSDKFRALGGWAFLRHLPDLRGPTLVYFPKEGFREATLSQEEDARKLREWLKIFDRVVALDSPAEAPEGLCARQPPAWHVASGTADLLRQIEADAGGPARFLTLYTEGREAGLWAALVEPRVSEIELAPPALPPSAQEGAALLLALLADRSVIVHRETLAPELLEQVQQSFKILGLEENLAIR
ncbi:MAG: hypothetical protein AB1405_05940 [Bdellovibrionota bacterium]